MQDALRARQARAPCAQPCRAHISSVAGRRVRRQRQQGQRRVVQRRYSDEDASEGTVCYPGIVTVSNDHPKLTKVTVESADYPGLLRVIAWVLNGLGLRVHTAALDCTDEGAAMDEFWVTDNRGRKPSDRFARDIEERLSDFLQVCQPPGSNGPEPTEYACGNIEVSNTADERFTQLTITAAAHSPGLLLEMASIITGQAVAVRRAVVVSGEGASPLTAEHKAALPSLPEPAPGTRTLRFWLAEARTGAKLDYASVMALVYTMRLVMGHGKISTSPPNTDINLAGCACTTPMDFDEAEPIGAQALEA